MELGKANLGAQMFFDPNAAITFGHSSVIASRKFIDNNLGDTVISANLRDFFTYVLTFAVK